MADDRLTAALDEIRKRVTLILDPHVEPVPVPGDDAGNARLRLAFKDVPRLLAALDRALGQHRATWIPGQCGTCMSELPCGTVRAIAAALLKEEPARDDVG